MTQLESVFRITVFGVMMMVKSSLEFFVLTSFHAGMVEFPIYLCETETLSQFIFIGFISSH